MEVESKEEVSKAAQTLQDMEAALETGKQKAGASTVASGIKLDKVRSVPLCAVYVSPLVGPPGLSPLAAAGVHQAAL